MEIKSGVYVIRNQVNQKVYVGSAVDIGQRWRTHQKKLKAGSHPNRHLQSSWNKYSSASFVFSVLERVEDKSLLIACEQKWMDELSASNPRYGYNKRIVAESNLGLIASQETREKLSRSLKGHRGTVGRKQPPEEIERRRQKLIGRKREKPAKPWSQESRDKLSRSLRGKKHDWHQVLSETTKQKISRSLKARKGKTYDGFISPDGICYEHIENLKEFCADHGLKWGSMIALDKRQIASSLGWTRIDAQPATVQLSRAQALSPRFIKALKRWRQALNMRQEGLTYREITERLGYAHIAVTQRAVLRALEFEEDTRQSITCVEKSHRR